MNENMQQAPMPDQVAPAPEEQSMQDGQAPDNTEATATKAVKYIYGDAETFASLMEMLKSSKTDPTNGIAQAAVMIIGKLEQNMGELPVEELSAAGVAVVMSLLDLANKAGIIPQVTEEIGSQAWGKSLQLFMKKNPGRIDPAHLQEMANQGGGAPAQAAPAAAAPAPQEEQGLLGG